MAKKHWIPGEEITADGLNHTDLGLKAFAQSTPGLTLAIDPGIIKFVAGVVKYAGGNSPSFTAPSSNPRIDLLTIDSNGTIAITQGTEAASPSAPTYPAGKYVICEVYLRTGTTAIYGSDQGSGGYIYKDGRPFSALESSDIVSMLAGEAISGASNPVPVVAAPATMISELIARCPTSATGKIYNTSYTRSIYGSSNRASQSFYSGDFDRITGFSASFIAYSNGTKTFTWAIYLASSHQPTGSPIASGTGSSTVNSTYPYTSYFSLGSAVTLSKNTEYCIVIYNGSDSNNHKILGSQISGTGYQYAYYSTNGGSSWTMDNAQYNMDIWGYDSESMTAGSAYTCKTNKINRYKFIGFAVSNASAGNSISVQCSGVVTFTSTLTIGAKYYVDSSGALTTTPSTTRIPIGIAISAHSMKIIHEPIILTGIVHYYGNAVSSSVPQYQAYVPPCSRVLVSIEATAIINPLLKIPLDEINTSFSETMPTSSYTETLGATLYPTTNILQLSCSYSGSTANGLSAVIYIEL